MENKKGYIIEDLLETRSILNIVTDYLEEAGGIQGNIEDTYYKNYNLMLRLEDLTNLIYSANQKIEDSLKDIESLEKLEKDSQQDDYTIKGANNGK